MSIWPIEPQEGIPTRHQVEASCEGIYAAQTVSWADWRPSEALWLACLSPSICARARMCRRQRARRAAIWRARNAIALTSAGTAG